MCGTNGFSCVDCSERFLQSLPGIPSLGRTKAGRYRSVRVLYNCPGGRLMIYIKYFTIIIKRAIKTVYLKACLYTMLSNYRKFHNAAEFVDSSLRYSVCTGVAELRKSCEN